ncbi:MAG: zinc ribbon domain-containing protein [Acidobacteriota bacterium]
MHCPRCGQQQVSEDIKFCSRCGFPLGLVSEVLAHGGFLPQLADLHKTKTKFTKKNGVIFSLFWFMFFLFIMTPFWGILDVDKMAGMSAIIGIFGGLMWLIGSLVLLKSSKDPLSFPQPNSQQMNYQAMPQNLYGAPHQQALPPQQSIPVSAYAPPTPGSWRETNDLVQPNSVTDETTKMFKNRETK